MVANIATLAVSRHAEERMRQRGFTNRDVELVCTYGTPIPDGYLVTRGDAKELATVPGERQRGERLLGAVVIEQEGVIVTVFRANKRWRGGLTGRGRRRRRNSRRTPDHKNGLERAIA